jgi:hypothetical protein
MRMEKEAIRREDSKLLLDTLKFVGISRHKNKTTDTHSSLGPTTVKQNMYIPRWI